MNWIQAWQTGNWSTDDLLQVCESIIYTTRTLQRSIDGLVVNYFSDNCNVSLVQLAASFPSHTYTCGCWHMASLSISPCLFTWASKSVTKLMKQERTRLIKILLLEMYAK